VTVKYHKVNQNEAEPKDENHKKVDDKTGRLREGESEVVKKEGNAEHAVTRHSLAYRNRFTIPGDDSQTQ
jgi:hypothetical protein